ncbi:MAG: type II toxin-antitoxin system RelE/ParE family toxin [Thermodesulfobacteriota bacterium]
MPKVELILYKEDDGTIPLLEWLKDLSPQERDKCMAKIRWLGAFGYELRRPVADYLRDGIYELRIRRGRVNYRILYFFFGTMAVVICHGLSKEGRVPERDIEKAAERKRQFEADPAPHMFIWGLSDGERQIH